MFSGQFGTTWRTSLRRRPTAPASVPAARTRPMAEAKPLINQQPAEHDFGYDPETHELPPSSSLLCPDRMSCFGNILCFPCTVLTCGGNYRVIVKPSEEVILLNWGKFFGVIREPGMYFVSPVGIEQRRVSLRQHTTERNGVWVSDRDAVPVKVSGVVVYRIKHAMHAMFGCDDYTNAVKDQVDLTLKEICSEYPFGLAGEQPSLRTNHHMINTRMVELLQPKVEYCGVEIMRFSITELSVAQEMQGAMLAKSKTLAMAGAKEMMVQTNVKLISEAIALLEKEGVPLSAEGKEKVAANMLTVMVSNEGGSGSQVLLNIK